jgi:hypothetical protein
MRNAKLSFLMLIVLIVGTRAIAAPVCFKSVSEYNAVKASLPKILQELPLTLNRPSEGMYPAAVLQIRGNGEKLYAEGYKTGKVTLGKLVYSKESINEVCVNNSEVTFKLVNGKEMNVKIENDRKVSYKGAILTKEDSANYINIVKGYKARASGIPELPARSVAGGGS